MYYLSIQYFNFPKAGPVPTETYLQYGLLFMLLNVASCVLNNRPIQPWDSLMYLVFCFMYQYRIWISAETYRMSVGFISIVSVPGCVNILIKK